MKTAKIGYLTAFRSVFVECVQIVQLQIRARFKQKFLHIFVTLENKDSEYVNDRKTPDNYGKLRKLQGFRVAASPQFKERAVEEEKVNVPHCIRDKKQV